MRLNQEMQPPGMALAFPLVSASLQAEMTVKHSSSFCASRCIRARAACCFRCHLPSRIALFIPSILRNTTKPSRCI